MDPFLVRMLERNKKQLSQLPESVAERARLREKQLVQAFYAGSQQNDVVLHIGPGAVNMQPEFKVPSTDYLYSNKLSNRSGRENKSPLKEIHKQNLAIVAPRSTELYPRRPPRSVYNSPLLNNGGEVSLIFEKRYKTKNVKVSPRRSSPKDVKKLNTESAEPVDNNKDQTLPKTFGNPYPSLPKINTSYDLYRLADTVMASLESSECDHAEENSILPKQSTPKKLNDVNICTGGVKKMVEKFSQSPVIKSPSHSPVRVTPKIDVYEKFNKSPLASSTVNSPVKVVVPKLFHILEPSKPVFREVGSKEIENPQETHSLVDKALPPYDTLGDRTLSLTSYNVDNFLKDALGSELFYQSISSIKSEPVFGEDVNMSAASDCVPVNDSSSIDPDPNAFLSLRLENTEKCRRPLVDSSFQLSGSLPPTFNERLKRLTIEANIQRSLVAQTSKALYLCRSAKQFKDSQELVEGERILLLASLRFQAAQEEIKKCSHPRLNPASRGSLTISDIFVPLKWDVFPKLDRHLCSQWFMCVLIMGETVVATEVVQLVDNQALLKFQRSLQLTDLSCDFRARLQLYALRAPHYSQKGKSRIMRACKILRRPTRNCLGPAGSSEELMYLRSPAFTMIGCTELTVGLVGQQQPVSCSLEQVPMVSLIKGTINFLLSAKLLDTRQHSGFLNVLRPAGEGNAWQRWWCHLDGKVLRCWNYPSDQEQKDPVFSIDLLECLSDKVVPAPRVLCSRPRTLMLESQRCRGPHDLDSTLLACSSDSTIVRHFLSCDSAADMTDWSSAINECLEALYLWNIVPKVRQEQQI